MSEAELRKKKINRKIRDKIRMDGMSKRKTIKQIRTSLVLDITFKKNFFGSSKIIFPSISSS